MPAKIKLRGIIQAGAVAVTLPDGAAHLGVVFARRGGCCDAAESQARAPMRSPDHPGFQYPNKIVRFVEAVFAHSPVT